jgi:secreted PhoX family phosphatase
MSGHTKGSRSATVCHYKCGDACAHPAPNETDTSYFPDVVANVVKRRTVMAGGLAAVAGVAAVSAAAPAAAHGGHRDEPVPGYEFDRERTVRFDPIDPVPNTVDDVVVPDGWTWAPIIAWGDPVTAGAPEFDPANLTPEAQAEQFGYNNDYLTIIPTGERRRGWERALLVANHEYVNPELMFPDWNPAVVDDTLRRNVDVAMYAHGLTVIAVRRRGRRDPWQVDPRRDDPRNRRIHYRTAFAVDGPAAGSPYLRTAADPRGRTVFGTLNNCAGGTTPWGTVLSGEENWNQYFKATTDQAATPEFRRYGIGTTGSLFELVEPRFDGSVEPNEPNRFGYIVEVDPFAPAEAPVKHTALGRFKHEGATIRVGRSGHVAAYMGDDERFDYVYKFVSARTYDPRDTEWARRHNKTLLSEGDLYVARFTGDGTEDGVFDGTGEWLPLVVGGESRVPGFTVEQVLVFTRLAADAVQPTKMDRPEDVQPSPATGKVYIACTNNTRRTAAQVDEANPRPANKDGHVVELIEDGDDVRSTTFTWNLVLVCGDPEDESIPVYFGGYTGPVSPISCPDNVAFDGAGNLWISTDGQPGAIGLNDALHRVVAEGPERGKVEQFLAVPAGAETCGPIIDSDDGSVFVAVQHPGDVDGASYTSPGSRFPYLDDGFDGPRPAVIQVYRGRRGHH